MEEDKKSIVWPALIIIVIIAVGGLTGFWLSSRRGGSQEVTTQSGGVAVQSDKEVGIKDTTVFKDTATGRIEINDRQQTFEGSHKLLRPGGISQTAYLNSSVVDLNDFLGKCVQLWGETHSAQKAAWFMDVGRIKILDTCPEGI